MKKCNHCGQTFAPRFPAAKLCTRCWRKREQALSEYDQMIQENARLADEIERLRRYPRGLSRVPDDLLPKLIRLCHPDRHGGSKAANEVTSWLLEQRQR